MFTGIVEQKGTVTQVAESGEGRRVVITSPLLADVAVGASISVNGACLTAVECNDGSVTLDVIPETLARTNLGELAEGAEVNLERPMPAAGRFDGHIVQGHVDGTGKIRSLTREEPGAVVMTIDTQPELLRYIVEKGSITVDGVSLTVASVDDLGFSVALIPHTLEVTTLGLRTQGDTVNLETDVLAKYVERLVSR
ncbi:MAG TPA: riboflavin synthase [Acidimicrobiia bacterium]|nr:riboflavin synthase [Acidimicrobiia bacterium]